VPRAERAPRKGANKNPFEIVAIAASAGGLTAFTRVLGALPASFGATIVAVQHLDPRHRSLMAEIIGRRSRIPVREAVAGAHVRAGQAYLAPPDHHMLINRDGSVSLTHTELVNFVRPSADLLFESVAAAYGKRAIAVVLTGTGHDGSMGVTAIKQRGGTVIAQDEGSSDFFGMPSAAIRTGVVDFVLPLDEIPAALLSLVGGEAPD
jgi:two-component system, chemotaxis family, protein-glutamate methylesterase/glutaminase